MEDTGNSLFCTNYFSNIVMFVLMLSDFQVWKSTKMMQNSQVGLVVMPIGAIDFIADSGQGHFHFDLIWNLF